MPDLMSFPSLMTSSHSLGVAYTKRLRMKRTMAIMDTKMATMVKFTLEVVAEVMVSVI
jgi:hypothetical protein